MTRTPEEVLKFKQELERRTKKFSVSVFRYLDMLPRKNSSKVIAYQLGRSASSVGANYHEANRAESMDDFVHKIGIALKECSETLYWLEIICDLHPSSENAKLLLTECTEILKILQTANRTMRRKK